MAVATWRAACHAVENSSRTLAAMHATATKSPITSVHPALAALPSPVGAGTDNKPLIESFLR
jgi:hypothetical protein